MQKFNLDTHIEIECCSPLVAEAAGETVNLGCVDCPASRIVITRIEDGSVVEITEPEIDKRGQQN